MVVKSDIQKDVEYYDKLPYTIILEQWDDGKGPYWVARVTELPHCLIHGNTSEEAVREIEEVKREDRVFTSNSLYSVAVTIVQSGGGWYMELQWK